MTRESSVLYLHGRGSNPDSPPGDLVAACPWGRPLVAPELTEDWLASPFSLLVDQVDRCLDDAALAVGHSFGAWLLLAAAAERATRRVELPTLVLLAPLLGKGFDGKSGIGYFAPRATAVRRALGFETGRAQEALQKRLRFVHAEEDDQTSLVDVEKLRSLGYRNVTVPGGHRLDHPNARKEVREMLGRAGGDSSD